MDKFSKKKDQLDTFQSMMKIAYDKGLIKKESSVEMAVKKLASKSKALDLSPTESVEQNLLKLCAGLRSKGFDQYADAVEEKIALIKSAEVHLYRAIDEDGEDLLQFAHPKDKVEVIPAKDDLGNVHGKLSQHEKILEVLKLKKASVVEQCKVALGEESSSFLALATVRTPEQVAIYKKKIDNVYFLLDQLYKRLEEVPQSNTLPGSYGARKERAQRIFLKCKEWIDGIAKEIYSGERNLLSIFLTDNNSPLNEVRKYCDVYLESSRDVSIFDSMKSDGVFLTQEDGIVAKNMFNQIVTELQQILYNIDNAISGELLEPPVKVELFKNKPQSQSENNPAIGNVRDVKNIIATSLSYFNNLLKKEDEIYAPIPDEDLNKISILDQAFDRAETVKKDLEALYNDLDTLHETALTVEQLESFIKKRPTFRAKMKFNSTDELNKYLSSIYEVVSKAVGLK